MSQMFGKLVKSAAVIAILMMASGCRRDDAGLTRVSVIGGQPKLVDNVAAPLSAGDAVTRAAMAQGLVRFDSRAQIIPGLAERWTVSDDGLSYIFRLKSGEWPDGRKVKAGDVARILSRQLRPANDNPMADSLGAVSEVVAMTDRVIEIRLISPRPNLLQLLAQPEMGIVRDSRGLGPFQPMTVEIANMRGLALEHRISIPDATDIKERVQLTGDDAPTAIKSFKTGQIELVMGGTVADLPFAQKANLARAALRFDPALGLFGLMPARKSKMTNSRDIRRLLSRAIDRGELLRQLQVTGLTPRATILQAGLDGLGTPAQPEWLGEKKADLRPQLAAEARQLIDQNDTPEVSLFVPTGPGGDLLYQSISSDWAVLGLTVKRADTRAAADYILLDEVAPSTSPAWYLRRFRCDLAPICLPETGQILADARTTTDARERAALFAAAATKMDEAQLFIPLAAPIRWSLVARGLEGFIENPFARHTLVGLKDARAREDAL